MQTYRSRNSRPIACLLLLVLCVGASIARSEVWVYPGPDEAFRSPEYRVTIIQGGARRASFVYAHAHQDEHLRNRGSDFNHWTTFSFSGTVTVEVERLQGGAAGTEIRPLARALTPVVLGRVATFTLNRPAKLWVRIPGAEEHPLFVFADAPEENIPDRADPNVIWFEPGKITETGERFMVKSGQTVYIPGGAYVRGSIAGESVSNVTIRGRGTLSGLGYPRRPGPASIPYNTINFNGPGENQFVEGITITNPTHFCILSRGTLATRNVKLFGFWHQTDGWGGGAGSSIEDSFLKVNDDNVKFYAASQTARGLVIYQQVNGAPFQLGWGGDGQSAQDCVAEDIDVIWCDAARFKADGKEGNQAFLNLVNGSAKSVVRRLRLQNIRVDDDIVYLVGLKRAKGSIADILLRDIVVRGRILQPNFLRTEDGGSIHGIRLENVRAAGTLLDTTTTRWATEGDVGPVAYAP